MVHHDIENRKRDTQLDLPVYLNVLQSTEAHNMNDIRNNDKKKIRTHM